MAPSPSCSALLTLKSYLSSVLECQLPEDRAVVYLVSFCTPVPEIVLGTWESLHGASGMNAWPR